jgi:hypothetical protein
MLTKIDFGETSTPDEAKNVVVSELLICTVCHLCTSFVGDLSRR